MPALEISGENPKNRQNYKRRTSGFDLSKASGFMSQLVSCANVKCTPLLRHENRIGFGSVRFDKSIASVGSGSVRSDKWACRVRKIAPRGLETVMASGEILRT
jgi:hypothetical protein